MYKNRRKTGDREEETLTKTPTEKTQRGERERSKIGKRKCMLSSLSLLQVQKWESRVQEEKTLTLERQVKLEEAAAKERQEALDVYKSFTHSFIHSFTH